MNTRFTSGWLAGLAGSSVMVAALAAGWGSTAPMWPWDVLGMTGFFTTLWAVSALLFRRAAG